jgi:hypothetical protein
MNNPRKKKMFPKNVSSPLEKVSDVNRGEGTSTDKTGKKEKSGLFRRGALG